MKQRIINYLLKYLLNAVVISDIIKIEKGKIYIDDKEVDEMELRSLRAEIKALEGFRIWHIITQTLKKDAYERGFVSATNMEHLNTSKIMLYNLDIQQKIINALKEKKNSLQS